MKITFLEEHYCPLVFGGGKGNDLRISALLKINFPQSLTQNTRLIKTCDIFLSSTCFISIFNYWKDFHITLGFYLHMRVKESMVCILDYTFMASHN